MNNDSVMNRSDLTGYEVLKLYKNMCSAKISIVLISISTYMNSTVTVETFLLTYM